MAEVTRFFRRPHKCHKCRFQQLLVQYQEFLTLMKIHYCLLEPHTDFDYVDSLIIHKHVILLSCFQVQHPFVFAVFLCMQRLLINKMVCVIETINIHFGNSPPPPPPSLQIETTDPSHFIMNI